jgi:hypothetical protein
MVRFKDVTYDITTNTTTIGAGFVTSSVSLDKLNLLSSQSDMGRRISSVIRPQCNCRWG